MARKLIRADVGGNINLKDGVHLRIPAGALDEDVNIETSKTISDRKASITLKPDGIQFATPVELEVSLKFLDSIEGVDRDLIGPDEEPIPGLLSGNKLLYLLDHFSIYYYRRR